MAKKPQAGRSRVMIGGISPHVENGRYAVKRLQNESLLVQATLVADGHDIVRGALAWRKAGQRQWQYQSLTALGNDRYQAQFVPTENAAYQYKVQGWIDYPQTWLHGLEKKFQAGQNISVPLRDGLRHLEALPSSAWSRHLLGLIQAEKWTEAAEACLEGTLAQAFAQHPQKSFLSESPLYPLWVDHPRAGFSAWYELFPRSAADSGHGTFADVEKLLPRIAKLGFDVLYLPPIHPIGEVNRKGKNNRTEAEADDVGSPWGIGSKAGGHKSIHPQLGNLADYQRLIRRAREEYGLEIALDLAYQCAPDHPYVQQHPQWFKWRADGTVQYAENPPKKYQDILPIYFESDDWQNLWDELQSVVVFWIETGVRIFRVDNPHTKSLAFWEWAIAQTREKYPDILFLSEAFTRPALMHQLAKVGFNQGYTYFTWRVFRHELIAYMEELTQGPGAEYFRPNFWPNTPDILPYHLQSGHEAIFLIRLFLAATLSSNYGVYGPVYELMVHEAVPGKEEYRDSEKYQISQWDWQRENKLTWLMQKLNQARRAEAALQQTRQYRSLALENENLYAYFKWQGSSRVLLVCSLDPYQAQEGWVQLPLDLLEQPQSGLEMHDLLTGNRYRWTEEWNYVRLEPGLPFHLFSLREA